MYSLILLGALSTGADVTPAPAPAVAVPAPAVGCTGCCGYAVSYSSCYGCSGACYGSSCHGCHGLFSCLSGLCHRHSCHSCSGYNCYSYSCSGCGGCAGYGGYYGSTWGPPVGMAPYTLHGYNQGGMYGYASPVIWGGVNYPPMIPPSATDTVVKPADTGTAKPADTGTTKPADTSKKSGMSASLKFRVPAETKLYVDGQLTPTTGTERVFSSPPLAFGQKFYYDVKAELNVNGKTVVEEMRVIVEAGINVNETFSKLIVAAAEKPSTVAGK